MFGLGIWELVLIFGIFLLIFGAKRLPEIAGGLGGAVNSFKKSLKEGDEGDSDTKVINAEKQIDEPKSSDASA